MVFSNQYFPPLALITASRTSRYTLDISINQFLGGTFFHVSKIESLKSLKLLNLFEWTFRSTKSQRFSMYDRSGTLSRPFNSFDVVFGQTILSQQSKYVFGSLSCWKIKLSPIHKFLCRTLANYQIISGHYTAPVIRVGIFC